VVIEIRKHSADLAAAGDLSREERARRAVIRVEPATP
jgi:hypothetical protein